MEKNLKRTALMTGGYLDVVTEQQIVCTIYVRGVGGLAVEKALCAPA